MRRSLIMRFVFLAGVCAVSTGCAKMDLAPLPSVTRVDIVHGRFTKDLSDPSSIAAIVKFVDDERLGWTRAFLFGFGAPQPFARVDLYDGGKYIGYFAIVSGVLPGGHAAFEVRYGNIHAQKRIAKSEANQFLDIIGLSGELQ